MSIPLLFKELRETAWMAAIALVVYFYSVGMFVRIGNFGGGFWDDPSIAVPFNIEGSVLLVIVGMCLAIALGLRQTVGERAHETFQFLLHRPPGLRWLIGTKLLVGVGLYLLVSGVPLLLCIWWAATRGPDGYPFKWAMTRLAWQGWLAGSILYLGAFLAGLRPACWFGTRLLVLIASVGLAGFFTFFSWPWAVGTSTVLVLDVLLVGTIFFVAQTRDFSWFGGLTNKPSCISRPCFLAALVGTGFGIAWMIVACCCVIVLHVVEEDWPPPLVPLEFREGTGGMSLGDWISCQSRGLDDIPTTSEAGEGEAHPRQDWPMIGPVRLLGPPVSRRWPSFRKPDGWFDIPVQPCQSCSDLLSFWPASVINRSELFRGGGSWRSEHFSWRMEYLKGSYYDHDGYTANYWYLVPDDSTDGTAYFDVHGDLGNGYVGRKGFTAETPSPEDCFSLPGSQFGFDSAAIARLRYGDYTKALLIPTGFYKGAFEPSPHGQSTRACFLLSGDRVLVVNLRDGSVDVFWESSETTSLQSIQFDGESGRFMIRTKSEILVLALDGTEVARFVIPEAIRRKTFWFCLLSTTSATTVDTYRTCGEPSRMFRFFWLNSHGNVEKERSVDLERGGFESCRSLRTDLYEDAIAIPAPAVFAQFGLFRRANGYVDLGECPNYPAALAVVFSHGWPALVSVSLLSVALAWVCYRRQKRYGQRWTWLWVGFVFLFGLPGWVGYRFHRRWPPLEPCPNCATAAPRDREACCNCGQDFPSPAPKGTEIFA